MHIHSMNTATPSIQERYTYCEYVLAAHPDARVQQRISEEKLVFGHSYPQLTPDPLKPAIVLANFQAKEIMEDTLLRWIQRICSLQQGFQVTLNNFSGLPPHTIYLRVQDPQPFHHLALQLKMIDSFIQSNDCPPVQLSTRPHLAFARDLSQPVYEEAIRQYAQRCFHESFSVDTLILWRRPTPYEPYVMVNTFTLPQGR
jgi:hypothetical protein